MKNTRQRLIRHSIIVFAKMFKNACYKIVQKSQDMYNMQMNPFHTRYISNPITRGTRFKIIIRELTEKLLQKENITVKMMLTMKATQLIQ